ncbi:AAC_HP2_G0045190.mRNA.1.CDS.1 [Saccharomyces cerevisiae]|nr:AAC_HP2_G0045190.mRNA.1.CDS.1 [Saccharomyces cerevisiae]CAI6738271.1 AAC_HP2_G0045190.mRNA.1.CDS.1 [Saccharomyces cerevisiae]CAI6752889.1 AAC_HP1_G0047230.mRNA.1.CDS.1 [Saccharomyces cerevisiae]CAI6868387.1 AAC_collapsed_G0046810.mRNA.1.CDS.1 [Saccharomyces cerevisiae]CAI7446342.1 CFC_collapsed_G0046480.mRNA.1.CDS.1 [Saccharomyces cerevisiae]
MSPPVYGDISRNINDLLNKDFYHATPAAFDVQTTTANGIKFSLKAKQPVKDGPLSTNVEAKLNDKQTGLGLTQGWSNTNNLKTKLEFANLTPGLKNELITSLTPGVAKSAVLNTTFTQPFFTARGAFDLCLKSPTFVGDLTMAHEGIVGGAEFGYDISAGSISRYAMALSYFAKDYSLGATLNNEQITTVDFFQNVNAFLQVGAKATMNCKLPNSNVNIEFATRYLPDASSQVKAKVSDSGIVTLAYKQLLRPGVTLGVGSSFDALKLSEPVHKLGWSLSFDA